MAWWIQYTSTTWWWLSIFNLSNIINDCEPEGDNDNDDINAAISDIENGNDGYAGNRGKFDEDNIGDCTSEKDAVDEANDLDNDGDGDCGVNDYNCDRGNDDANNEPACVYDGDDGSLVVANGRVDYSSDGVNICMSGWNTGVVNMIAIASYIASKW